MRTIPKPRKCYICHHPSGRRKYCARHLRQMKKIHAEFIAHREAFRRAWSEELNGLICHYTRILLDEADPSSPLHYSFDHQTPGKPGDLVLTFARLNSMKKDLSGEELRLAARLLDALFDGKPFDKEAMHFWYYKRSVRAEDIGLEWGSSDPISGFGILLGQRTEPCDICGFPAPAKGKYCARCNRWILHHSDKAERAAALKLAWDPVRKGFVCQVTGVLLNETDFNDPWYLNFDHIVPGEERLQVVAGWINGMKADLSMEQFRAFIRALARHFRTGEPFDVSVLGI